MFDPNNLPEGVLSIKKNKSGIRVRTKYGTAFYRIKATQEQVLAYPYPQEEINTLTKQGLIVSIRDVKQKLYNFFTKNYTVVALKELLGAYGLPKTGKKHDLVMHLVNRDYNNAIEFHNRQLEAIAKAKAAAQRAAEEEMNLFEGTDL